MSHLNSKTSFQSQNNKRDMPLQSSTANRLRSISIEFGTKLCQLRCPYCYSQGGRTQHTSYRKKRGPLSIAEILDVLSQGVSMGLGGVGIIGPSEPLLENGILTLIEGIRENGFRVTIFTKGMCINDRVASELNRNDVNVAITIHSLQEDIHDRLTGCKGSFQKMKDGLNCLMNSGYSDRPNKIIIQSVIARQNIESLSKVWRWAKREEFTPFFERITIQGWARANYDILHVSPKELSGFFQQIAEIDKEEFDNEWTPQPPWVGNKCTRHEDSCHMTFDGYIQPCTGVDIPLGNIRDMKLQDIFNNSRVLHNLRNIRQTIKGACGRCKLLDTCYGCRGQAYQFSGDYLASDPFCWKIIKT